MAVVNRISEQEFRELALNEPDQFWELWDGEPREKPSMSSRHNAVSFLLGHLLQINLIGAIIAATSTATGPAFRHATTTSLTSW